MEGFEVKLATQVNSALTRPSCIFIHFRFYLCPCTNIYKPQKRFLFILSFFFLIEVDIKGPGRLSITVGNLK